MMVTKMLSEELYNIQLLSEEDVSQLHKLIMDYFAAAFAGFSINRDFNSSVEKVIFSQKGTGESHILGQKEKFATGKAAFMNALYGHGAELDDGNRNAAGHAGVHLIPAVFALADKLGSTKDDVLIALATGYEAFIRISSAAQPGMVQRGFHSTGMTGTIACAAACSRLYHHDASGIENAIALATTMSGGLLSYGDSRPAIKPLNPAKAAENGVFAAMIANEGVEGPQESLEGIHGWFHAVTDHVNYKMLEGQDHLLIHDCYFKLYPSCRHTHCGIDAAIALRNMVSLQSIKQINVYIYPSAINLAGQIRVPQNSDETKFSICYTLACALINGRYGIPDMDSFPIPSSIVELINKINLISDQTLEDRDKGIRGTRVEILKNDNSTIETTVLIPRGDPENPLTKSDIIEKLRSCSADLIDTNTVNKLVVDIENIYGNGVFINPLANLIFKH